jgi:hypothetical protein
MFLFLPSRWNNRLHLVFIMLNVFRIIRENKLWKNYLWMVMDKVSYTIRYNILIYNRLLNVLEHNVIIPHVIVHTKSLFVFQLYMKYFMRISIWYNSTVFINIKNTYEKCAHRWLILFKYCYTSRLTTMLKQPEVTLM